MTEMQGHLGKMTWQEGPLALGDLPTTMLGGNGEGGFIGSKSIHGDVSTTVWTLGLLQLSRLIFLLEASEPWTQQRQPPSLPERMKSACAGQNAVTYYIMFKHHWQQIPDPVSVSKSEEGAVAAYSPPPSPNTPRPPLYNTWRAPWDSRLATYAETHTRKFQMSCLCIHCHYGCSLTWKRHNNNKGSLLWGIHLFYWYIYQ